ncbi:unnamed protein product [Amoebophrya sp. A120]|nr:unnamed protein product [Amoebophrya sp. A120]|eukprot:GSA120T00010888001.1
MLRSRQDHFPQSTSLLSRQISAPVQPGQVSQPTLNGGYTSYAAGGAGACFNTTTQSSSSSTSAVRLQSQPLQMPGTTGFQPPPHWGAQSITTPRVMLLGATTSAGKNTSLGTMQEPVPEDRPLHFDGTSNHAPLLFNAEPGAVPLQYQGNKATARTTNRNSNASVQMRNSNSSNLDKHPGMDQFMEVDEDTYNFWRPSEQSSVPRYMAPRRKDVSSSTTPRKARGSRTSPRGVVLDADREAPDQDGVTNRATRNKTPPPKTTSQSARQPRSARAKTPPPSTGSATKTDTAVVEQLDTTPKSATPSKTPTEGSSAAGFLQNLSTRNVPHIAVLRELREAQLELKKMGEELQAKEETARHLKQKADNYRNNHTRLVQENARLKAVAAQVAEAEKAKEQEEQKVEDLLMQMRAKRDREVGELKEEQAVLLEAISSHQQEAQVYKARAEKWKQRVAKQTARVQVESDEDELPKPDPAILEKLAKMREALKRGEKAARVLEFGPKKASKGSEAGSVDSPDGSVPAEDPLSPLEEMAVSVDGAKSYAVKLWAECAALLEEKRLTGRSAATALQLELRVLEHAVEHRDKRIAELEEKVASDAHHTGGLTLKQKTLDLEHALTRIAKMQTHVYELELKLGQSKEQLAKNKNRGGAEEQDEDAPELLKDLLFEDVDGNNATRSKQYRQSKQNSEEDNFFFDGGTEETTSKEVAPNVEDDEKEKVKQAALEALAAENAPVKEGVGALDVSSEIGNVVRTEQEQVDSAPAQTGAAQEGVSSGAVKTGAGKNNKAVAQKPSGGTAGKKPVQVVVETTATARQDTAAQVQGTSDASKDESPIGAASTEMENSEQVVPSGATSDQATSPPKSGFFGSMFGSMFAGSPKADDLQNSTENKETSGEEAGRMESGGDGTASGAANAPAEQPGTVKTQNSAKKSSVGIPGTRKSGSSTSRKQSPDRPVKVSFSENKGEVSEGKKGNKNNNASSSAENSLSLTTSHPGQLNHPIFRSSGTANHVQHGTPSGRDSHSQHTPHQGAGAPHSAHLPFGKRLHMKPLASPWKVQSGPGNTQSAQANNGTASVQIPRAPWHAHHVIKSHTPQHPPASAGTNFQSGTNAAPQHQDEGTNSNAARGKNSPATSSKRTLSPANSSPKHVASPLQAGRGGSSPSRLKANPSATKSQQRNSKSRTDALMEHISKVRTKHESVAQKHKQELLFAPPTGRSSGSSSDHYNVLTGEINQDLDDEEYHMSTLHRKGGLLASTRLSHALHDGVDHLFGTGERARQALHEEEQAVALQSRNLPPKPTPLFYESESKMSNLYPQSELVQSDHEAGFLVDQEVDLQEDHVGQSCATALLNNGGVVTNVGGDHDHDHQDNSTPLAHQQRFIAPAQEASSSEEQPTVEVDVGDEVEIDLRGIIDLFPEQVHHAAMAGRDNHSEHQLDEGNFYVRHELSTVENQSKKFLNYLPGGGTTTNADRDDESETPLHLADQQVDDHTVPDIAPPTRTTTASIVKTAYSIVEREVGPKSPMHAAAARTPRLILHDPVTAAKKEVSSWSREEPGSRKPKILRATLRRN